MTIAGERVLYHGMVSTCSQKVRLALAEKGLPYTARQIDFPDAEHLSDWYLRLNPNGVVPTLVDGAATITDSSVICEYLDEVYPDPPLGPRDAAGRAAMRAWMRYLEEVPTAAIRAPSFNAVFGAAVSAAGDAELARRVARMPVRRHFYQAMEGGRFADAVIAESEEHLRATLLRAEAASAPYLLGADLSIADLLLLPTVVRLVDLGMARLWADLPGVAAWLALMTARPSFAAAFPPAARVAPGRIGLA